MSVYAIRFDFPEGGHVYCGLAGEPPAAGFAPTPASALTFEDREHAVSFLQNAYGAITRGFGSIVELADVGFQCSPDESAGLRDG